MVDRLHEHGNLVVDIRQSHAYLSRGLARRGAVVSRRDREVVRVARRTIVVESPDKEQLKEFCEFDRNWNFIPLMNNRDNRTQDILFDRKKYGTTKPITDQKIRHKLRYFSEVSWHIKYYLFIAISSRENSAVHSITI